MVSGILERIPSFTKLRSGRNDDWTDRMSHVYTVVVLIIFAVIVSTSQFVGDPIHCWCPAEFNDKRVDYTKSYCWIKNTYHIPFDQVLPVDAQIKQDTELTYYQWVPLILLFQAFMFKFPNMIWRILNPGTGLHLTRIAKMAEDTQLVSAKDRTKTIEDLANFVDRWLSQLQPVKHNYKSMAARASSSLKNAACFMCNKRQGRFLTTVFLFVKLLYVVNVIGQFFLLDAFMAMDYPNLGPDYIRMMETGLSMRESRRFPRVTMCDFKIRQLQNIQNFTVQCVLPINLFNEKIFIFLWFWFIVISVLCVYSLLKWCYLVIIKKNSYRFVKKYLVIAEEESEVDRKLCRRFAERYLRDDGCFVLRIVGMNSTELVVVDLLQELYGIYKNRLQSSEKSGGLTGNSMEKTLINGSGTFITS